MALRESSSEESKQVAEAEETEEEEEEEPPCPIDPRLADAVQHPQFRSIRKCSFLEAGVSILLEQEMAVSDCVFFFLNFVCLAYVDQEVKFFSLLEFVCILVWFTSS